MALNLDKVGETYPDYGYEVTRAKIHEYARALGESDPRYLSDGEDCVAPPTFAACFTITRGGEIVLGDPDRIVAAISARLADGADDRVARARDGGRPGALGTSAEVLEQLLPLDEDRVREARAYAAFGVEAGRDPDRVAVLLDVETLLGPGADDRLRELDGLAPAGADVAPSTVRHVGDPGELATLLREAAEEHAADGFVFVPLALPSGIDEIVDELLPALGDAIAPAPYGGSLRERFGLTRPVNRYVVT